MPPAFLNHRVPTACGTPTPTAASSLAVPAAIASQNRRRSSRPATGGRPGENKRTRPERSECRFRMFIATPVKVLRRPLESAQYTSVAFGNRCKEAGVRPSTGSVGDAYDNAMCESFFATLECELIDRRRSDLTARRGWPSFSSSTASTTFHQNAHLAMWLMRRDFAGRHHVPRGVLRTWRTARRA